MLFRPGAVIVIQQDLMQDAQTYAVGYQVTTTVVDLGILIIFLGIISLARFLVERRKTNV